MSGVLFGKTHDQGKFAYAANEEEAISEARACGWEAVCIFDAVRVPVRDQMPRADDVLGLLRNNVYDNVHTDAEETVSAEGIRELEEFLDSWVQKHVTLDWYQCVGEVRVVELEATL